MSVVRIRESPSVTDGFLKKIYENFVGTLETVRNREEFVPRGSTVSLSPPLPPPPLSIVLYEPTTANEQVPSITALSSVEGGMASPLECNAIHVIIS